MGFVAENRKGDHGERRSIRAIPDFPADLECPAGVGILLCCLVRLVRPDISGALARLDRFAFALGVALSWRRHQRGVHDLPRHWNVTLLLELPVKGLHHPLECSRLGQTIAKMPDRVLVRRPVPKREPRKPQPTQPVADHELHPRIRQVVLRLQDQRLEHHHRIEGRATALAAIAIAKPFDQPRPEILEIHRILQNLERISLLAQRLKVIAQTEQGLGIHEWPP